MDGNISQGTSSKHTISNVNNGCSTYGHRESVVNLELGRLGDVALDTSGQEVEEHLQQVQVLPGHIGHLEDWTHPARQQSHKPECPCHFVMVEDWTHPARQQSHKPECPRHFVMVEDWTHPVRQQPHNLECPHHSVMLDTWKTVSKLVFYAQSSGTVISGRLEDWMQAIRKQSQP